MDLFDQAVVRTKNWLPEDGEVNYYGPVINKERADLYMRSLLSDIDWRNDEVNIFGKRIVTKRKVAWYGDRPFEYTYSNTSKYALKWTDDLLAIKLLAEVETGECFNSCLLNLYHSGAEGMAWHSDNETDLRENAAICSLSFGAERKFVFRHRQNRDKVELYLQHGSLLVMKGTTQRHWLHRLPTTKKVTTPRINLTFRTIQE